MSVTFNLRATPQHTSHVYGSIFVYNGRLTRGNTWPAQNTRPTGIFFYWKDNCKPRAFTGECETTFKGKRRYRMTAVAFAASRRKSF